MLTVTLSGARDIDSVTTDWNGLDGAVGQLVQFNASVISWEDVDAAIHELRRAYDHPYSYAELPHGYELHMVAS